ncbi:MAG: hypothetical protein IJ662_11995 [Clostridia bacterium]|nr:hypothetical protein [Clostridia bacterium]
MRSRIRRWAALLSILVWLVPSVGALAEFSPRYTQFKQRDGMMVEWTGSYTALDKLSKKNLETVNEWLSNLKWIVKGRLGGTVTTAAVEYAGEEILSVASRPQGNGAVTLFSPSGNAYWTAAGQKTALAYLAGEEPYIYDILEFPALYDQLAKALYPVLDEKVTAKTKKARTTVKNATASPSYRDYALTADEMNAAWSDILTAVLPTLREALADQPGRCGQLEELLGSLTFSGECRFKRLLDKNQGDMGMQFTGSAGKGSDVRKVTLFGGYTADKGGYLSLSLPQVKGKNKLTFRLSVSLAKAKNGNRTLKIDVSYNRLFDKVTEAATVAASLKNVIKGGDEAWSGKVTITQTENKVKTTYTLTPALAFTDAGLSGDVTVQRKRGSKVNMKAAVHIDIAEAGDFTEPEIENPVDLSGKSDAQAKAAVQAEIPGLVGPVVRLMSTLPENERILLTHELRTDEWMTGDTVPLPTEETRDEPTPGPGTDWNEEDAI